MLSDYDKYITNEPTQRAQWCVVCNKKQDCGEHTSKGFVCVDCEDDEHDQ